MTTDTLAPPDVLAWIQQETTRGVGPLALNGSLVSSGWAPDQAARMLEAALRRSTTLGSSLVVNPNLVWPADPKEGEAKKIAAKKGGTKKGGTRETEVGRHEILVSGRTLSIEVLSADPYVAIVRGILDLAECAELRQIALAKLARSTTVNKETGLTEVIADRTSEGMFFMRGEDAFIGLLEERMADVMGYPTENGEGLQILHYNTGGQYRPHHDYFDPSHSGSAVHLAHGGQRVSTMVMYLNTPEAGGFTEFPTLGIKVPAEEGSALLFAYGPGADGIPDIRCLHAGCPVEKGEKWIATKWVRQGVFA